VPDSALVAVPHLVRRTALGNFLMPEMAVILELTLVQVFEYALLLFGSPFYALIELILRRVLYFLALELYLF